MLKDWKNESVAETYCKITKPRKILFYIESYLKVRKRRAFVVKS